MQNNYEQLAMEDTQFRELMAYVAAGKCAEAEAVLVIIRNTWSLARRRTLAGLLQRLGLNLQAGTAVESYLSHPYEKN